MPRSLLVIPTIFVMGALALSAQRSARLSQLELIRSQVDQAKVQAASIQPRPICDHAD